MRRERPWGRGDGGPRGVGGVPAAQVVGGPELAEKRRRGRGGVLRRPRSQGQGHVSKGPHGGSPDLVGLVRAHPRRQRARVLRVEDRGEKVRSQGAGQGGQDVRGGAEQQRLGIAALLFFLAVVVVVAGISVGRSVIVVAVAAGVPEGPGCARQDGAGGVAQDVCEGRGGGAQDLDDLSGGAPRGGGRRGVAVPAQRVRQGGEHLGRRGLGRSGRGTSGRGGRASSSCCCCRFCSGRKKMKK